MQPFRRTTKAQLLRDSHKIPQVTELHTQSIYRKYWYVQQYIFDVLGLQDDSKVRKGVVALHPLGDVAQLRKRGVPERSSTSTEQTAYEGG